MANDANSGDKALFFILGAFVGAVAALLLAPRSGEETRKLLADKTREGSDFVANRTREVAGKTTGYIDRGKELVNKQRDQFTAAIEAGKQAHHEEKDKAKS